VGDVSREYYRAKQEEQQWTTGRDPLEVLSAHLIDRRIVDRPELDRIHAELASEMDAAVQWAIDAPYPSASEATEDVYA